MNWDRIRTSFYAELAKIAEVSLVGLSPQTLLAQKQTPVFSTPGLAKANTILDRYEQKTKLAAKRKERDVEVARHQVPGIGNVAATSRELPAGKYDTAKSGVLHGLAGLTGGSAVGDFLAGANRTTNAARKFRATGAKVGVGIAGAEFTRKLVKRHIDRKRAKKAKTAAVMQTPGLRLMASRKVGTKITSRPLRSGPTLGSVTRRDHVGGTKKFGVL